ETYTPTRRLTSAKRGSARNLSNRGSMSRNTSRATISYGPRRVGSGCDTRRIYSKDEGRGMPRKLCDRARSSAQHLLADRRGPLDRGHEVAEIPRPVETLAVDEEGRSAVHAASNPGAKIGTHALRVRALLELLSKALQFEPELPRVAQQVLVVERALIVEERVVHPPEFPLGGGRLGRLRRPQGVRMDLLERKVSEH